MTQSTKPTLTSEVRQTDSCPNCDSRCWTDDPETGEVFCESCGYIPTPEMYLLRRLEP